MAIVKLVQWQFLWVYISGKRKVTICGYYDNFWVDAFFKIRWVTLSLMVFVDYHYQCVMRCGIRLWELLLEMRRMWQPYTKAYFRVWGGKRHYWGIVLRFFVTLRSCGSNVLMVLLVILRQLSRLFIRCGHICYSFEVTRPLECRGYDQSTHFKQDS